jgi:hypothetical protein
VRKEKAWNEDAEDEYAKEACNEQVGVIIEFTETCSKHQPQTENEYATELAYHN